MAITWADVVCIAPALATVPVMTQDCMLADVLAELSPDTWEEKYDLGVKYLLAHFGTLWQQHNGTAMAGGPVTKEKVGQVERDFANPWAGWAIGDALDLTIYGQVYRRLLRGLVGAQLPLVT